MTIEMRTTLMVVCKECDGDLKGEDLGVEEYDNAEMKISVEPCGTCMENADEKGYARGVDEED